MDNSLLNKLAPELRNTYYELALNDSDVKLTVTNKWPFVKHASPGQHGVALTAVCKQIRNECLMAQDPSRCYFLHKKFLRWKKGLRRFYRRKRRQGGDWERDFWTWLLCIGPANRNLIHNLDLYVYMPDLPTTRRNSSCQIS
jgi:hypothetical protein